MHINVRAFGPFETNGYWIEGEKIILVDAPPDSFQALYPLLKDRPPSYLLMTHSHWDHTADVSKFKKAFPEMKIVIGKEDAGNLEEPGSDGLPCWIAIDVAHADIFPEEGEEIEGFRMIKTPGHTPGGLSFYCPKEKILFSGDTLFKGTIGNLSFPTSRPSLMWQSLKKLATLPKETIVYPGHGEPTTIGNEPWLEDSEKYFG
jgi:hydroxyacylglutathione hydrolase